MKLAGLQACQDDKALQKFPPPPPYLKNSRLKQLFFCLNIEEIGLADAWMWGSSLQTGKIFTLNLYV